MFVKKFCWFFVPGLTLFVLLAGVPVRAEQWYKGNTHTHSLWSDGDDFPEMIVDRYRRHGYDFLALSDHNILSEGTRWMDEDAIVTRAKGRAVIDKYEKRFDDDWIERREENGKTQFRLKTLTEFRSKFEKPGEFLLIQGEEITDGFENKPVHINAANLQKLIPPQHGQSVRDTMRNNFKAVRDQEQHLGVPILAHLNHPNFGWAITAEDIAHVVEEHFFEVYNGHPAIHHMGNEYRPGDERLWDIANTLRIDQLHARPLFGVATDDAHNYHGPSGAVSGRGWVMVRAERLSPEALIHAMRAGDFYASSGVVLRDVRYDRHAHAVTVEVDPKPGATYTIQFIGTRKGYDPTSRPAVDGRGKRIDTTRIYSNDIGEVLVSVEGVKATYKLGGDELYVRGVVTSSLPPQNPSFEGQKRQAWTQPVGWEAHIPARAGDGP